MEVRGAETQGHFILHMKFEFQPPEIHEILRQNNNQTKPKQQTTKTNEQMAEPKFQPRSLRFHHPHHFPSLVGWFCFEEESLYVAQASLKLWNRPALSPEYWVTGVPHAQHLYSSHWTVFLF